MMIGESVEVVRSTNRYYLGIKGKVIDETQNMLIVETAEGVKRLIKKNVVLKVGERLIDGKSLVSRLEDRIKR